MAGSSNISGDESIIFADNASFDGTERGGKMTTNGQFWMGATVSPHVRLGNLTSLNGSVNIAYSNPTATTAAIDLSVAASNDAILTLTPDADFDGSAATPISPQAGNVNTLSYNPSSATVTNLLNTTGAATGNLGVEHRAWLTPLVVDPSATIGTRGTYQTIAAALTAASSGQTIFIRSGTYTENLTLKAGVNLVSFDGNQSTPNVTIIGNATLSTAGTCTISGIRLQTNSGALLTVSGSVASIVFLNRCYLNCTNNDGITFSSSSASAEIRCISCRGNLTTTGIKLFNHTSAGSLSFNGCQFENTGLSTTASTASAGILSCGYSIFSSPITTSSTNALVAFMTSFNCTAINTTALTVGGAASTITTSEISGGSASALSVGGTLGVYNTSIASTNTNSITGAGTISFSGLDFISTSNTINTTTQTANITRPGITLSAQQPSFLAYLAATALNKTGNGAVYTLGTDALTEVFDQGGNFNTNGTFTAPYTGRYQLNAGVTITGATIATTFVLQIVTSNRTYQTQNTRAASAANQTISLSVLADMDVADTATVTITVTGEAADTDDIFGGANPQTFFSGYLVC